MKKFIFSDKTEESFVTFEGHSKGFWINNDNVRYCHTNLNHAKAMLFHKKGVVTCKEFESSEIEYEYCIKKADLSDKEDINEWLKYFNIS